MQMRTVHAEPQWNFDSVSIFFGTCTLEPHGQLHVHDLTSRTINDYTVYCQSQKRILQAERDVPQPQGSAFDVLMNAHLQMSLPGLIPGPKTA